MTETGNQTCSHCCCCCAATKFIAEFANICFIHEVLKNCTFYSLVCCVLCALLRRKNCLLQSQFGGESTKFRGIC